MIHRLSVHVRIYVQIGIFGIFIVIYRNIFILLVHIHIMKYIQFYITIYAKFLKSIILYTTTKFEEEYVMKIGFERALLLTIHWIYELNFIFYSYFSKMYNFYNILHQNILGQ